MDFDSRIMMAKPDFPALRKKGLAAVDMHFHTRFSDTYTRIENVLSECRRLGTGVAITDHNAVRGAIRAYRKRGDVMVVPGIEVSTREGPHILAYFYDPDDLEEFYEDYVEDNLNGNPFMATRLRLSEMLDALDRFDCITSAAHPFCPGYMGINKMIKRRQLKDETFQRIGAVEVITGINTKAMTRKSVRLAALSDKPITAGSDGHSLHELGRAVTFSKADSLKKFLNNITSNKNSVVGSEIPMASRMPSYLKILSKHIRYGFPTISSKYRSVVVNNVSYYAPVVKRAVKRRKDKSSSKN